MLDYKNIIKKRSTRIKLLNVLSFVPDKLMISIQYRIKTSNKLNLKNPTRFSEKLQWYKLYYRNDLMRKCVDKYEVRKYIKQCEMENNMVKLLGIYNNPNEINKSILPKQFVIKDTLGGGGTSIIICKDIKMFDWKKATKEMEQWINVKHKDVGREWVYNGNNHRILIEEFINSDENKGGLIDYKFFCFNGKVEYIYVVADRILGERAGFAIYDKNFIRLEYYRADEQSLNRTIDKPENFAEMIRIAEKLSMPFPHVRVDLYDINDNTKILFGELTFFDGSGYMKYYPDEFDFILGDKFILPKKII